MARVTICILLALVGVSYGVGEKRAVESDDILLAKISKARNELKDESVQIFRGVVGTQRVRIGRRKYKTVPVMGILAREMAVAVMDPQGKISVARAIKRDIGLEVQTPGFIFSLRRDNGINSDIACIQPAGGKVVAVKYPVSNEGRRFGPGDETLEVVYTPYSPEIATEAVVERGIQVQRKLIDKAYERLKEWRVLSRAFPGRSVSEVIPEEIVTVLLINEHIDPGKFVAPGLAEPLARQVLTIIGTNSEKAYAYSVSPAGARGLVQMIPSTYALLRAKYPEARLHADFAAGMADALNALAAQVLLCDADWQTIRSRVDLPSERVGPYLAAAYNGGVGRVLSVLDNDESPWMEAPDSSRRPTKTITRKVPVRKRTRTGRVRTTYVVRRYTTSIFKAETNKYIRQYHWINDFFVRRGVKGFDRPQK